jgi:uncharacterized protein (DUF2141 family)
LGGEVDGKTIGTDLVAPASGATFLAGEIVQINSGYTEAETLVNGDTVRLAMSLEDAVDPYYRAAGAGAETSTKTRVAVRGLKGKTVAMCVAAFTSTHVNNGTSYGIKRDATAKIPYIDTSDTTNAVVKIVGVLDGRPGAVPVTSDTYVMVKAVFDDAACATFLGA